MTAEQQRLAGKTVDELIACFNGEVGKDGWVAARCRYLVALRLALLATGLDCSSFIDDGSMSLASRIERVGDALVVLDGTATGGKLILVPRTA